jgi:hypothetical protein
MAKDEDFESDVVAIRYDTSKPWNEPERRARWQLLSKSNQYGNRSVKEDDIPVERALAIAELLGCREKAVAAMQAEVQALKQSAAARLRRSREERMRTELHALDERAAARELEKVVARAA